MIGIGGTRGGWKGTGDTEDDERRKGEWEV